MKNICINLFTFFFIWNLNAQSLITVEGAAGTSFYSSVPDAVEAAEDGDIIYIPGGNFVVGELIINKSIQIIGVGYDPDSSSASGITILEGTLRIVTGADGGSISGFYMPSGGIYYGTNLLNQNVNNYYISRVDVEIIYLGFALPTTSINTWIDESIIRGNLECLNLQNLLVTNTFIGGQLVSINGLATFNNNIFLYNVAGYVFSSSWTNYLYNNLFLVDSIYVSLFEINENNIYSVIPSSIFINQTGNVYNSNHDYHLKPDCIGVNAGSDGTDIGIYGSNAPFKDGAVPINPHIQFKSIGTSTNADGDLPINIKVAAQDN